MVRSGGVVWWDGVVGRREVGAGMVGRKWGGGRGGVVAIGAGSECDNYVRSHARWRGHALERGGEGGEKRETDRMERETDRIETERKREDRGKVPRRTDLHRSSACAAAVRPPRLCASPITHMHSLTHSLIHSFTH